LLFAFWWAEAERKPKEKPFLKTVPSSQISVIAKTYDFTLWLLPRLAVASGGRLALYPDSIAA
jgi:hypothetical protein